MHKLGCPGLRRPLLLIPTSAAAVFILIRRIFFGVQEEGWASLIVSVWLVGGLILFCQGMIAIYIAKIFLEVKQRPRTITRHFYARAADPHTSRSAEVRESEAGAGAPGAGQLVSERVEAGMPRSNGERTSGGERTGSVRDLRPVGAEPPEVTT